MEAIRDYNAISKRLNALNRDNMQMEILETINGYPVYTLQLMAKGQAQRRILMSAGTHGNEPAGPEAVLQFLEREPAGYLQALELLIVPCINPFGYVHNTRKNADGIDINRSFEADKLLEVIMVKRLLQGQRFDLFIEFHEDWEYSGFYLFELCGKGQTIGPEIIRNIEAVCPIHQGPAVDGMHISNGIVIPSEGELENLGTGAMPLYVYAFHADHVITCESPSQLNMKQRVAAHLVALDTALTTP